MRSDLKICTIEFFESNASNYKLGSIVPKTRLFSYILRLQLKKGKFKPEYTGKLNFYLSVVDDMVKLDHHNPTVGMLLCETKNEVIAQYAVDGMTKPMGISQYELSKMLTKQLKGLESPPKELEEKTEKA